MDELALKGSPDGTREGAAPEPLIAKAQPPLARGLGSLRVTVRDETGALTPNVHVIATAVHVSSHQRHKYRRATDTAGVAYFPDVTVGVLFSND